RVQLICDRRAAVLQAPNGARMGPHVFRVEVGSGPAVPEDGEEHVVRLADLGRWVDGIDQHEAVRRLDGERADLLLPLPVPGGPAAQPWRDLLGGCHGSHPPQPEGPLTSALTTGLRRLVTLGGRADDGFSPASSAIL